MDSIPWTAIGVLTPPSFLGPAVWMTLTVRLVRNYLYEVMVKAKDQWRSTAETLKETRAVQTSTIEKQAVVRASAIKVMGAIDEVKETGPR